MYVYTKHGMAAFAAYHPERKHPRHWLEDPERRALHEHAAHGGAVLVVRGWQPQVIADIVGPGQEVFEDPDADYYYRGLVDLADMPHVFGRIAYDITYPTLKEAVWNSTNHDYYSTLVDVHDRSKDALDWRMVAPGPVVARRLASIRGEA